MKKLLVIFLGLWLQGLFMISLNAQNCSSSGLKISKNSSASHKPFEIGANYTFKVPFSGNSYQWLLNGIAISGATDSEFTVTEPGVYSCEVDGVLLDIQLTMALDETTEVSGDREILNNFFADAGGSEWNNSTGWGSLGPLSTWHGVETNTCGRVTSIQLINNNVIGNLPESITGLTELKELEIEGGLLGGSLPANFNLLSNLETLKLTNLGLSEPISSLNANSNLTTVALENNNLDFNDLQALSSNTFTTFTYAPQNITANVSYDENTTTLSVSDLGGNTYQWHKDGTEISGATNTTYIPTESGDYHVVISHTDLSDLTITSDTYTVTIASLNEPDRERLISFFHEAKGGQWNNSTNWLSDEPIDTWHGVTTDGNGNVTQIKMWNNNLSGALPPEVADFPQLELLSLSNNELTSIPAEIGNLTNLKYLVIQNNDLSSIPPEIGNLQNLEALYVGHNKLTTLPAEIGNMTSLKKIFAFYNRLNSLPLEILDLPNLTYFTVESNYLDFNNLSPFVGQGIAFNYDRQYQTNYNLLENNGTLYFESLGENQYKWTTNEDRNTILSTNPTFTPTESGNYFCTITHDQVVGVSFYFQGTYTMPNGRTAGNGKSKEISNNFENTIKDFKIYPNPTKKSGNMTVNFSNEKEEEITFQVFDLNGKEMLYEKHTSVAGNNEIKLKIGDWKTGVYILRYSHGNISKTKKVLIE